MLHPTHELEPLTNRGRFILYPAAFFGDEIAEAAEAYGLGIIRTDANALYPRSSRLMRWLENCAAWCCNGWHKGDPRWTRIVAEGCRLFSEALTTDEQKSEFGRSLLAHMWQRRNSQCNLFDWLVEIDGALLSPLLVTDGRTLADEKIVLNTLVGRVGPGGDVGQMGIGQFSGEGEGNDRINLSSLHSAKGREFDVTVLFGMDDGRIPRANASQADIIASRRLFYVGFTRARLELHMVYSAHKPSPFVTEVEERLNA